MEQAVGVAFPAVELEGFAVAAGDFVVVTGGFGAVAGDFGATMGGFATAGALRAMLDSTKSFVKQR